MSAIGFAAFLCIRCFFIIGIAIADLSAPPPLGVHMPDFASRASAWAPDMARACWAGVCMQLSFTFAEHIGIAAGAIAPWASAGAANNMVAAISIGFITCILPKRTPAVIAGGTSP